MQHITQTEIDLAFDEIVRRALAGERAPVREEFYKICGYGGGSVVPPLCNSGRIRSEVYARNWRVFEIRSGPHMGARTMEPPSGGSPYFISEPYV